MNKSLKSQAKKLPDRPGVYLFKNTTSILYIGKAANLKSRLASYFFSQNQKIQRLLNQSTTIKIIKTETVLEALILESNLIKRHRPFFNVVGKDSKSFAYILIPRFSFQNYPSPFIVRGQYLKKYPAKNFHLFGPYQTYFIARQVLAILRKIFPFCDQPNSGRPCFHFQINLCPGACVNRISKQKYRKNIENLIFILKGNKKRLVEKLKKDQPDKIEALNHIQDSYLINRESIDEHLAQEFSRIEGYDISHFAGKSSYGAMVVFENNRPQKRITGYLRLRRLRKR